MLFKGTDSLDGIWETVMHELHRAALDKKHPFRFVTLATISGDQPDMRYVVLREMDEHHHFYCYTDSRSQKVVQLNKNPTLSLLFYHPKKRCQVKVHGTTAIHHQNKISQKHWKKVQGEARKAYQASIDPGKVIDAPTDAHNWDEEKDHSHFVVLQMQPNIVECLQLDGLRHLRAIFKRKENSWAGSWLAP